MEVILGRSAVFARIISRSSGFGSSASLSTIRCLCSFDPRRSNPLLHEPILRNKSLSTNIIYPRFKMWNILESRNVSLMSNEDLIRTFATQATQNESNKETSPIAPKKLNIFQKMKQLTRDYWHILIPVHLVTSCVWVAIFYSAAKNGVDIISIMEFLHISEKYIDMIRNSKAGDLAVTYALYKIFTPLRYTVTVGGTTMSIRYLDRMGYLNFGQPGAASARKSNVDTKKKTDENRPEHSEQNSARKN